MFAAMAEIACIILILSGIVLYFTFRIRWTCNELGFGVSTWKDVAFRASVLLLTSIGLISTVLVLIEE